MNDCTKDKSNIDSKETSSIVQPSMGLKLILKRQHGDKYEIRNPNSPSSNCSSSSSRPRRKATRKVKFDFGLDESPVKKQPRKSFNIVARIPKLNLINCTETCIPFEPTELVEKTDHLLNQMSRQQIRISVNHSVPFPIALVEDKTNIVHTKALLMIHLYQSYSSPCIICVLCKQFFSIPDFSKHFHIGEDDLDTESSDEDLDQNSFHNFLSELDQKKEKKLKKLRKKSYKILPYFLNQNNELNENQLKTWKLFSGKFASFKSSRQKKVDEHKELEMKKAAEEQARKRMKLARPKSKRKPDPELCNWDFISDEKEDKYFFLNRNRLECEKIVYLETNDRCLSDMDTDSDQASKTPTRTVRVEENRKIFDSNEPDLSLSEDDDVNDQEAEKKDDFFPNTTKSASIKSPIYFYDNPPSKLQRQFNYYENMSPNVFNYINQGVILVPSLSLVMFNLYNKFNLRREVLLAKTDECRLKWLSIVLDFDLK